MRFGHCPNDVLISDLEEVGILLFADLEIFAD